MEQGPCTCGGGKPGEVCPICRSGEQFPYWCESCERGVAEKRCPFCGLKAKKQF